MRWVESLRSKYVGLLASKPDHQRSKPMHYSIDPPDHIIEVEKKIADFAKEAVKKGAALLDEYHPDGESWGFSINPAELLMSQTNVCILGQTYGDYNDGLATLNLNAEGAWEMGFVTPLYDALFTDDEKDEVHAFEVGSITAWDDAGSSRKDQMPWLFESVFYGHLSHAWRELLVSRGYDANGTPALALISKEYHSDDHL
jgi:hypothetical protein